MDKGVRADGRSIGDLRPLYGEVGTLPRVHGSALFSRGETQALAITTLAPADENQHFDNYAGGEDSKRFILHYNFPPFSVGETGRIGGINRREIGHGALAERSIEPVIPDEDGLPLRHPRVLAKSWSPTVPPRWPRFAPAPWRCWTPACRSTARSAASPSVWSPSTTTTAR